jgi:hypothetical protein
VGPGRGFLFLWLMFRQNIPLTFMAATWSASEKPKRFYKFNKHWPGDPMPGFFQINSLECQQGPLEQSG